MKKLALVILTSVFASVSFADFNGTVTVYDLQTDPQTKIISIKGAAAEELYGTLSDDTVTMLDHNGDQKTIQKNGKSITCNHTTIFARGKSREKHTYNCDITIKGGSVKVSPVG